MTKVYDKSLDDEYGKPAEKVVVDFLKSSPGIRDIVLYPFGTKDVDLLVHYGVRSSFTADVERRANWKSGPFPFRTVNVPFRKKKFIDRAGLFYYFVVRDDLKFLLILDGKVIEGAPVIKSENRYTEEPDEFYSVPLSEISRYVEIVEE